MEVATVSVPTSAAGAPEPSRRDGDRLEIRLVTPCMMVPAAANSALLAGEELATGESSGPSPAQVPRASGKKRPASAW
jgi:hypothetical protein